MRVTTLLTILLLLMTAYTSYFAYEVYECKRDAKMLIPHYSLADSAHMDSFIKYIDTSAHKPEAIAAIIEREATKKAHELQPLILDIAEKKPNDTEKQVIISTSGKNLKDTIKALKNQLSQSEKLTYYYRNKYIDLSLKVQPLDSLDKGEFLYTYNADLDIKQYYQRNRFLGVPVGAKTSHITISSRDSNTTIMGNKTYTFTQKNPEFGFRLRAIGSYNFRTHGFTAGPVIQFDIMKGAIRGNYMYNFQSKQWVPSVSLEKDLIRF